MFFVFLLYYNNKAKEGILYEKHIKKIICLFGLLFTLTLADNSSIITLCDISTHQIIPPQTEPGDSAEDIP